MIILFDDDSSFYFNLEIVSLREGYFGIQFLNSFLKFFVDELCMNFKSAALSTIIACVTDTLSCALHGCMKSPFLKSDLNTSTFWRWISWHVECRHEPHLMSSLSNIVKLRSGHGQSPIKGLISTSFLQSKTTDSWQRDRSDSIIQIHPPTNKQLSNVQIIRSLYTTDISNL